MGFAIFAITTLTIIYGLVGLRIIQPAKVGIIWKIFLWAVLLVFYTAIILTIIFRFKFPHSPVTIPLSWFGFVSFGFVTLTFPFILFRDIVFIICKGAWGLVAWVRGIVSPARTRGLANPSRRQFLVNTSNIAVLGVTGSLTGYGLAEARRIPEVVAVKVPLENLPPAFEGFKILQITDLHIGMTIRRDYVQAVVEKANDLDPDIIVMTGDLADGSAMDLGGEATPLADLQASFGKFFVTGNHEYYSGVGPWLTKVTQWGFIPLMNTHRIIRHRGSMIVLAGVTDYRASRIVPQHASDPEAALAGVPENMVKIMLAHQPKSVYKAETAGADLLICGHTHGGQYFPWNYMVSLDQPYVYGLHWHGKTQVYVSRGTGYWGPPIRIGAPSEITLLRIVRKQG
jgi:predicted MPP superfamily phosphohydrolase